MDFYPRSPCGERLCSGVSITSNFKFLSTLSLRRATNTSIAGRITSNDFYPRSPCGERRSSKTHDRHKTNFYPRSPCGERPVVDNIVFVPGKFLSTLSLRRATADTKNTSFHKLFLSTLSLRRATHNRRVNLFRFKNFYPRSPCGERPHRSASSLPSISISIHALLAESDTIVNNIILVPGKFLSTLSLRRATASHTNLPGEN